MSESTTFNNCPVVLMVCCKCHVGYAEYKSIEKHHCKWGGLQTNDQKIMIHGSDMHQLEMDEFQTKQINRFPSRFLILPQWSPKRQNMTFRENVMKIESSTLSTLLKLTRANCKCPNIKKNRVSSDKCTYMSMIMAFILQRAA